MNSNESADDSEKMGEFWASAYQKKHPEIEFEKKRAYKAEFDHVKWRYEADLIEREWQQRIGGTFPGWSDVALAAVIDLAEMHDTDQATGYDIYRRAMDVLAGPMQPAGSEGDDLVDGVAVYHGEGLYQVGDEPIRLTGYQADVLETLVKLRAASFEQLVDQSGCSNPSAVLSTIREGHSLLAPFIKMAVRKGGGGYSTTIRNAVGKQITKP